ncbi:MAG: hypothetical protein WCB99_09460 [Candidatus Cybelea sp.]|jgi:hypothetical protein
MPKRLMIILAVASLAIAACHSYTTPPVTSSSPFSPSPNPAVTKAAVLVTILQTPAANIPVEESTPTNATSPRPGRPFVTKKTDKKGLVNFNHLIPSQTYCWVAVLGTGITSSICAAWPVWQTGTISLGT